MADCAPDEVNLYFEPHIFRKNIIDTMIVFSENFVSLVHER